jgi:hypothetical protein
MKTPLLLVASFCCATFASAQQIPSPEVQIKTALMAAPQEDRENAKIYGYSAKGEFVVLREGKNEMVCLADDPNQQGFNVSCYHKDLDAFMERGRQLKKEGKTFLQINDTREAEVKSGKLKMPAQPSSLFVFTTADDKYNRETGEIKDGYLRYVIYIPYATAESTGLPLKPDAPGMPWLMDAGTHKAHIMINPPVKEN